MIHALIYAVGKRYSQTHHAPSHASIGPDTRIQVELLSLLLTFQESKWADVRLAGSGTTVVRVFEHKCTIYIRDHILSPRVLIARMGDARDDRLAQAWRAC